MDLDWLTLTWLMNNLEWIIAFLSISILILFFFPVLLGYDLYKKDDEMIENED